MELTLPLEFILAVVPLRVVMLVVLPDPLTSARLPSARVTVFEPLACDSVPGRGADVAPPAFDGAFAVGAPALGGATPSLADVAPTLDGVVAVEPGRAPVPVPAGFAPGPVDLFPAAAAGPVFEGPDAAGPVFEGPDAAGPVLEGPDAAGLVFDAPELEVPPPAAGLLF
jgi:hypothetical protein